MIVSFRNNSFNQFNVANMKPANINNTPAQKPVIKTGEKESSSYGALYAAIGKIGGAIAGLGAIVAGVIKRKNIVGFVKKLINPNKTKKHVVKLYDNIKEDLYAKEIKQLHTGYTNGVNHPIALLQPNGVIFYGESQLAKDKSIKDLVEYLKKDNWEIVNVPKFDASKASDSEYCENYIRKSVIQSMLTGMKEYKQSGKHTAVVVRGLDVILEKNPSVSMILPVVEDLQKNGCTWITDYFGTRAPKVNNYYAYIRDGRIDEKIRVRPFQEDTKEIWNAYLRRVHSDFSREAEQMQKNKNGYYNGEPQWYLQDAIDRFPEAYRESSELYQKLKDTKFYPFEF